MMKTLLLSTCLSLTLLACKANESQTVKSALPQAQSAFAVPDSFKLEQSVKADSGAVNIPFDKFTLANGLTVVLHKDTSDPLVHVDITYHVGSGREEVGKSGFAHFFEHMMFQGSENVADEEHFKLITESGGTLNGSTTSDRTNYYETVPSNQLEKMLWLEADRMGYFLNAVTEDKFENQRDTVKNERGQNYDNRPYGLLYERVGEALYPEGHPYSWSTIGYIEDLNRATLNDLKKFFLRWYGPNNATLTIGGDIDEAQTLAWIEKYFGPIPRGPEVKDPVYTEVTLDADRYISMEDNVQLPLLFMSWPTVHANHPDEAPLDVLMSVMGEGRTSLLYKNLEKSGLAIQASAGHGCQELTCEFTLYAYSNPGMVSSLADIETALRDSLDEFEARGVEDDDLIRVKSGIVSSIIYGLESVTGKVTQLAYYNTFRDNPDGIAHDIARYENVTKADVMRVYEKYVKNKPAVIMSIVPTGQTGAIAKADTWDRYERDIPDEAPAEDFLWTPPQDNFDRSIVPPSGANPTVKVPPIYRQTLANGINVLGARNAETPTTTLQIKMDVGQKNEPLDKLGLANLTSRIVGESSQDSSVEEISNRLAKLGSSVNFYSNDNSTTVYIRSLTKNIDETIAIAMENLLTPKLAFDEFDRLQDNQTQNIKSDLKDASVTASNVFSQLMYGRDNNFAYDNQGTVETIGNLTLQDVKDFYANHYSPKVASVVVVSDLDAQAINKALEPLSKWEGPDVSEIAINPFPELETSTIYFIDKPDAAQSEIRIGKRALPYDATGEYYRAGLMNYALGGAFNSRINLNLREDKGYTYGARSGFSGDEDQGWYRASAGVRADATAASIEEFIAEIDNYHTDGITPSELAFTQSAIGQRDARTYETPSQKLSFLSRMMTYDLEPSFVDEQAKILQTISKADLDNLSKKHLNLDEMIMVVVGDKAKHMDEVKALGFNIVELDPNGNPL